MFKQFNLSECSKVMNNYFNKFYKKFNLTMVSGSQVLEKVFLCPITFNVNFVETYMILEFQKHQS